MAERIGGYVVERLIGAGGMGMVYLAKHETLHRKAAVKVLMENLSTNPQIRERFIQEAKLMAGLDHQNIVTLYDFTIEPKLSLIMEFVDGRGLDQMIGQEVGPIPWEKALPLFSQILDGVGYAHSKGIIHRDIKPANILISKEGKVKITDLGIAKIAGQQGMTRTGVQMGTLYYESPEQIQGARDVDHRSDVYSLGMTLFEMLAGRLPFETDGNTSEFAIMSSVVHRKVHLDPRDYYPHVPEWLVQMIQKATELDPADRFQSCEDFKQEIIKSGNLADTESGFWSGRVASTPSIPLVSTKTVLVDNSVNEPSEDHCPKCDTYVDKETELCPSCGHNLMKNCPSCQFSFRWFTKFCPSCGVDVENPGSSTNTTQGHVSTQHNIQPPPPPKASSFKALWVNIPVAIIVFIGIIAAIAILKFSNGAETPDQVVQKLFDGVQSADGDAVVSCLSAEVLAGFDEGLEELKADPEGTAAMAVMFGVEITADEVSNLTAGRAISLVLSSEMLTAEMPDFSSVEIGTAVIDGETATVPVTMDGETDDIELVLEDGSWKIGGEGMDFM